MGEDPIAVAPHLYDVLFENERVRLIETKFGMGDSSPMHSHPDYLVFALEAGKAVFRSEDGETVDVEMKAGDVMWRDAETHAVDAAPDSQVHVLLFELK